MNSITIASKQDLEVLIEGLKVQMLNEIKNLIQDNSFKNQSKIWLTEKEACTMLDVSKSTIQNYRRDGILNFSQYGNKIKYKLADLHYFLDQNYVGNGR